MNNNSRKRKEQRQNLYVTVTVILMMVTVIVAIAVSLAKNPATAEKDPEDSYNSLDRETNTPVIIETDYAEDVFFEEDEDENDEMMDTKDTDVLSPVDTESKANDTESAEDTDSKAEDTKSQNSVSLPEFMAPVQGEILKGYSLDVPVFSLTMDDFRTHAGIDIYCSAGCDVASVADGTVTKIWNDPMMGTSISIEHEGGAVSVYKNLCETIPSSISEGTKVEKGQIIATAGDTALIELAEESHLHFELSVNGKTVDPSEYIEFSFVSTFAE